MTNLVIPEDIVRLAAERIAEYCSGGWPTQAYEGEAQAALEAVWHLIQAQTLRDAVHAFPLETITTPDNAVTWLMRRAEEIRGGHE